MRRREFITLVSGAATAWPIAARAQQPERLRRAGMIFSGTESDPAVQVLQTAVWQELEKLGWRDGRNIHFDARFAASPDQFQSMAKELVALRPDAILAQSTPVVAALQSETRTIPIVFGSVSDPIGSGFVGSLAQPGSNITGFLLYEDGIIGKCLAMLKEIAPNLARAAIIALQSGPLACAAGPPSSLDRCSGEVGCIKHI